MCGESVSSASCCCSSRISVPSVTQMGFLLSLLGACTKQISCLRSFFFGVLFKVMKYQWTNNNVITKLALQMNVASGSMTNTEIPNAFLFIISVPSVREVLR